MKSLLCGRIFYKLVFVFDTEPKNKFFLFRGTSFLRKNKFFLFLGKNFLENLSFTLEFSFRYTMVTQKICPELFWSQFVTHV